MDKIEGFKELLAKANEGSSKVREFLNTFLDESSFVETNAFSFTENDTFSEKTFTGEGAVTGFATVSGYPVCVFAQNAEVLRGGFGKKQADKIVKLINTAVSTETPVVAVFDSEGARLGEGIDCLEGYATLYRALSRASDSVLTVAVVKGECYGQIAYCAGVCDFLTMVKGAHLATTSPVILSAKAGKSNNADSYCGAAALAKNALLNDMTLTTEDIKSKLSRLFDFVLADDDEEENFDLSGDLKLNDGATAFEVAKSIADNGELFEIYEGFCDWSRTFFAEIGGTKCGILASDVELSVNGARRMARFVGMCDAFELPVISIVNSNGTMTVMDKDSDMIYAVSGLMDSIATSNVPKIAVIAGNAVGASYTSLASKNLGFDYTIAFANARISPLSVEAGAEIVYAADIQAMKNSEKALSDAENKYAEREANPVNAAIGGNVDNIIEPALARANVIAALATLKYKA